MKLASIELIEEIKPHPNADSIEIAKVLGFQCVVQKIDNLKPGDRVVFIQPDTILPDVEWAAIFKAKSSRVKAIKLRGVWSEGIVMRPAQVGIDWTAELCPVGAELGKLIGVTKYEPPVPQDLSAKGPLPFDIPKTDEERFNNILELPYGALVDVTLKIDGQSFSAYCCGTEVGVCGRTLEYKLECENKFSKNFNHYNLGPRLLQAGLNICIRGEQYGAGVQSAKNNPHCTLPVNLAFFSVWLIDERRYAHKGESYYAHRLLHDMQLPLIPMLERDVPLTPELLHKYSEGITQIDGKPFEGVVIQHSKGSFKVMNKAYDAKK